MPTVSVSPQVSKPSHDLALGWKGNKMGFNFENGEPSLVETPSSPPPSPFQWKQSTWEGGRANARFITDQTAYFDANSMYSLTPENLHPVPQWGIGSGLVSSDEYCPQTRNVSWKPLYSTERYIASSFDASASNNRTRIYVFIRAVGAPGTLTLALYSNSGGSPNAALQTATITTATVTDVLSLWQVFNITSQAVTSTTTYWIVAIGASTDDREDHWEVGIDAAPATFSKYSTAGSVWATATYKMYFRCAIANQKSNVFPFFYLGAQFIVVDYANAVASKIFINGDLRKASAGTSTTITMTAAGGISWATDQLVGGWVNVISGTADGMTPRQITANTSGTTSVLTVSPAFDITPDSTSIFCVYGVPYWKEITSPANGLTRALTPPAVGGKTVYFAQGTVAIRRMYFDAATGAYVFAADGTNTADFLRPLNDQMYKLSSSSASATAATAPFVTQGTNLTFTGVNPVGTTDYKTTGLCDYNNAMYAAKEDGLFKIINGRATRINYGGENLPSRSNGRVMIAFGDSLYFSFLHSLERMTNSTIDDIGWWRHEGMPAGREGIAVGATTFLNWIIVGIRSTATNGVSSVLCWNGFGWHELFRAFTDGARVTGVSLQPCEQTRPRLWIFVENEAYYIDFPHDAINPLRDSGMVYMHESHIVTSTIDLGKENFDKIFRNILLQSKNLSNTTSIFIDYQTDNDIGSNTWTPTNENKGLYLSPVDTIDLNLGNVNMIRLRLRFYTETATTPPILLGVQMNGNAIEPPRYQWNATIKVSNIHKNDFAPDDVVNWLKDAASNMRILEAFSTRPTLHGKWVYVSQPTIITESRNLLTKKWTGRIVFTIREA